MIVNGLGTGTLEIVYQRNHALLAAALLRPWEGLRRELNWVELFNATAQHDHGWIETNDKSLLKEGRPVHFLEVQLEDALELSERAIVNGYLQSSECGILISRHAEHLYADQDSTSARRAVGDWEARRKDWMKDVHFSASQLEDHYQFLLWADSLSLLLICEPSDFTAQLELRIDEQEFHLTRPNRETVTLAPWPFLLPSFTVEWETLTVPERQFSSSEELHQRLSHTPRVKRRTLIKG